jgi:ubiquinone/menaquinone biosynthesis C-methylase UbiE
MKNTLNTSATRDLEHRKEVFKILTNSKDLNQKKILDIGCGYGAFILYALEKGAKEVCGVEISKEDLKTAQNTISSPKVRLFESSALNLPFPDNYFDTVVSFEVLEHIPKNTESQMFKEISRVLKKGGVLYLSTPFDSFLSKYLDPAYYLIDHRHYNLNQIEEFSQQNDLKILKNKIIGSYWELLNLFSLYFSKWILRREKIFAALILKKVIQDLENKSKVGFMTIFIKAHKTKN